MNNQLLTDDQLKDIETITITLTDEETKESWTATKSFTGDTAEALSQSSGPVIAIEGKNAVRLSNLPNGHKFTMVAEMTGAHGLKIEGTAQSVTFGSEGDDLATANNSLTNQLQAPSLTLVKKVGDDSLLGQKFHFTITFEGTDKTFEKDITVTEADKENGAVEVLTKDELKGIDAGTKFTVEETAGEWNTSWLFSNEGLSDSGIDSLTAEGVLYYGDNVVTFTNNAPSQVSIPVSKLVTGDKPDSIPSFTFTLGVHEDTEGETGFIMPANRAITLSNADFAGGTTAAKSFESIQFTKAGTYKFTVRESKGTETGWTYDSTVYTVTIHTAVEDGKLVAKVFSVAKDNGEPNITNTAITFTNTYEEWRGSLTIQKEVEGGGSAAANKVYSFTVTGPNGYKETVTVKGENSVTIEKLVPGEYSVTEADANISGFKWSVKTENSPVTVTAKGTAEVTVTNIYEENHEGPGPARISVHKVWEGDTEANRPSSVTVQLYKNGVAMDGTVTLNAGNGWSHEWTGLADSDENGAAIVWSVDEVNVPDGYEKSVAVDGMTFTITNTYEEDIPDNPPPTTDPDPDPTPRPDPDPEPTDVPDPEVPTTEPDPEPTDVPDPEVPTTDIPEEPTDVPDPEVPTTDIPDVQPPLVDLPPEQPPLIDWPPVVVVPEEDIPEDDVPLADVPQTGDYSLVWCAAVVASIAGLAVLTLKKREDEEN